jgi:nucleoid-associated protein YgaU
MARHDGLRVRFTAIKGETPKGVLTEPLLLPAVLGDFGAKESAAHRDFETVGLGEVSQPSPGKRSRSLQTSDFETLSIIWDPDWLVQNGMTPGRLRAQLRKVLRSKRPFLFAARLERGDDAPFLVRMPATLRDFDWTLKHAENDTLYFTVSIKEWRPLEAGRRSALAGRNRGGELPTVHALKENDTLRSLAKKYYGSYEHWRVIGRVNGIANIGGETKLVTLKGWKAGDKVKIPLVATTGAP